MHQLLGSYFEAYQKALQSQGGGRNGRRSFHGRAYVPTMIPQGIKAEEIR
jgi:hypothetical protein